MASKIPVGQTIARAYRFAFGDFIGVLGVVWLPLALVAVAGYFLFRDVSLPAFDFTNPQRTQMDAMQLAMFFQGPLQIFELVLWAFVVMIEVGLTRLALGIGRRPLAFFTLGWPFWRMLGANLIVSVILLIVVIPIVVVVMIGAGVAGYAVQVFPALQGMLNDTDQGWLVTALMLFGFAIFIGYYYVFLRLWFLIAPVVVAEKHMDIRHPWRLARGNVLRIFVVCLGIFVPLVVVIAAIELAVFALVFHAFTGPRPDTQFFVANWPIFAGIGVVAALLWLLATALIQGARAAAYRALVPAATDGGKSAA